MAKLPVLQSGFVALNEEGLTLPNPLEPTVREAVIYKAFKSPLMDYFYSKEITEMFNRWSANREAILDFSFRERILKTALRLPGTKSFKDWLNIQTKSKAISVLHGKFLMETVEHVVSGTPRRVEAVQWIGLLEAGDQARAVHVDTREYLKIRKGDYATAEIPDTFEKLVVQWTRSRQGFEDLLICLYVIYGLRSRQTGVADLAK